MGLEVEGLIRYGTTCAGVVSGVGRHDDRHASTELINAVEVIGTAVEDSIKCGTLEIGIPGTGMIDGVGVAQDNMFGVHADIVFIEASVFEPWPSEELTRYPTVLAGAVGTCKLPRVKIVEAEEFLGAVGLET